MSRAEDYKKVAEFIHTQFRPAPQPDTQPDAEVAEDQNVQTSKQMKERSAADEAAQEQNISAPADANQRPDTDTEQSQNQPPIEIRPIPQPDSQAPSSESVDATSDDAFTQTIDEENRPESQ